MAGLFILASVLVIALTLAITQTLLALLGVALGAVTEEVSLGIGPCMLKCKVGGIDFKLSAIPLGAYT